MNRKMLWEDNNLKKLTAWLIFSIILTPIITQLIFMMMALFVIYTGNEMPLIFVQRSHGTITISGNTVLIVLGLVLSLLLTYPLFKKRGVLGGKSTLYGIVLIVIVVAILFLVTVFGAILACAVACAMWACNGNMQSCNFSIEWLYVIYYCYCVT